MKTPIGIAGNIEKVLVALITLYFSYQISSVIVLALLPFAVAFLANLSGHFIPALAVVRSKKQH